jgi:hypothetical protein
MTIHYEIVGPYIAATIMSLGALSLFIWGVFSGAFHGADEAALRFFHREMSNDGTAEQRPQQPGPP